MSTQLGFMIGNSTFKAELPAYAGSAEFVSTAGLSPGSPLSIQCGLTDDVHIDSFGWEELPARPGADKLFRVAGDLTNAIPVWRIGPYTAWMQVRSVEPVDLESTLVSYLRNIRLRLDDHGIPRVSIGGLSVGNRWADQINRQHIIFPVRSESRVIVLREDGALGSDYAATEGGYVLVAVTTRLGITVMCDGPRADRNRLRAEAAAIAQSLVAA